jgi:protein-S-isoprenylcysteine O-methyltransferase Ste14
LAAAVGITLYILIGARLEERKLLSQFGEDYRAYQQKVPMFIPGLKFNRG